MPRNNTNSALGFEAQLWAAAEQAMPAPHCEESEYNNARPEKLALGFIFLNIPDAFEENRRSMGGGPAVSTPFPAPTAHFKASPGQRPENETQNRFLALKRRSKPCPNPSPGFIDANLDPRNADSLRTDLHPDLKANFVPVRKDLASPPFSLSDWGGENLRPDVRWKCGILLVNNTNYAWVQHFNRSASRPLATLRTTLLPTLLSGGV